MQIGRLRHRVTIQNPATTPDGKGGETELPWVDSATAFCEVKPIDARERFYTSQIDADVTHQVTMRYTSAITAESRLDLDGRVLQVVGAPRNIEERDRIIVVQCKEEVP